MKRTYMRGISTSTLLLIVGLVLWTVQASAQGQPPTLTSLSPSARTDVSNDSVKVTLNGSNFQNGMSLVFDPTNVMDADTAARTLTVAADGKSATVTFKLSDQSTAPETVNVSVQTKDGHSEKKTFDTGVESSTCLEALKSGQCVLLWEVEGTSASGNSGQTGTNTTPNILVKLDWQWHSAQSRPKKSQLKDQFRKDYKTWVNDKNSDQFKSSNPFLDALLTKAGNRGGAKPTKNDADPNADPCITDTGKKAALKNQAATVCETLNPSPWDRFTAHATFKSGYTQAVTATKTQAAATTSGSTTTCPSGSSSSGSTCTSAVPQDAFVAEAAMRIGWVTGVDEQKVFGEFGFDGRGSFQYLIPTNKVVQSGGLSYLDLSSFNPNNAVGFYEATGHFRLSHKGHNITAGSTPNTQNNSDLLVVEGGYQNNRGLQQLMASDPSMNTRNRYVARFYLRPELPNAKHTQLTMGVEYSGGMNGGPHVVQLFFGTNVNPTSLFKGGSKSN